MSAIANVRPVYMAAGLGGIVEVSTEPVEDSRFQLIGKGKTVSSCLSRMGGLETLLEKSSPHALRLDRRDGVWLAYLQRQDYGLRSVKVNVGLCVKDALESSCAELLRAGNDMPLPDGTRVHVTRTDKVWEAYLTTGSGVYSDTSGDIVDALRELGEDPTSSRDRVAQRVLKSGCLEFSLRGGRWSAELVPTPLLMTRPAIGDSFSSVVLGLDLLHKKFSDYA